MEDFQNPNPMSINLRREETILWSGNPNPGIKFHPRGIIALGFWSLITIITIVIHAVNHVSLCFVLYSILFTLFNTTCLLLVDPIRRQKTSYLVTNQRIIIKSSFISQSVRPVELNSIKKINRIIYRDGPGTIIFDKDSWRNRSSFPPYYLSPVFEFIDEPERVYAIIENARAQILQSEISVA
jgi:hypothetical protein